MREDIVMVTPNHRSHRPRLVRDEGGQGMVEFALILPVLLLILVGILEFGSIYSNVISMRQGVREAGRQGSVAQWGSTSSCGLIIVGTAPSLNIQKLMCLTKAQVGVQGGVKLRVNFDQANLTAGGTYAAGNAIVICAAYPIQSLTGLFQPFLNGRVAKTKAAFRIENAPGGANSEMAGGEADPTNQNWSWCT